MSVEAETVMKHTRRLRFSINTLLSLTAYVAFACAWCYWIPSEYRVTRMFFPGWLGLSTVALLIWIGFAYRWWAEGVAVDALLMFSLMTAWCLCSSIISNLSVCSCCTPTLGNMAVLVRDSLGVSVICTLTVPLFAALPVVFSILRSNSVIASPATKWFLLASVIAWLDLLLLCVIIPLPFTNRFWE